MHIAAKNRHVVTLVYNFDRFCRVILCKHGVCVCVCLSRSWIVSTWININISPIFFSPLGSHTILVFLHQMSWQYSDGNPPNRGVECRWVGRNVIMSISGFTACCQCCNWPGVMNTTLPDHDPAICDTYRL